MAKKTARKIMDERKIELLLFTAQVIKPMLKIIGLDLMGDPIFGPLYRNGRLGFVIKIIDSMGDEVRQLAFDIDTPYSEIASRVVEIVDVYRSRNSRTVHVETNIDDGMMPMSAHRTITGRSLRSMTASDIEYNRTRNVNFGRAYGMNRPFRYDEVELRLAALRNTPTDELDPLKEEIQPKLPKRRIRNKSEE